MTTAIAILGPGTLGLSFARHAAEQGFQIRLAGRTPGHAKERLLQASHRWLRGQPTDAFPWMERILPCETIEEALHGSEALLEALPEDLALKADAWRQLNERTPPDVLRWTGTSSLSLSTIRQASGLPPGLMGFHLFVPVRQMRIVELARESASSREPLDRTLAIISRLGLRAVSVLDQPGFAASRMALAQGLEAMRLLERGVATAEDLDALMVLGYGHPVGPLELSDRVGLDLRLRIAEQLHQETGDPVFEPPIILRTLLQEGRIGRKSGCGFFCWDAEGHRQ